MACVKKRPKNRRFRRVVTATDQDRKSHLHSDGIVESYKKSQVWKVYLTNLRDTTDPRPVINPNDL
jgi:hypothetical protein